MIIGTPSNFDYDRFTEALVRLSAASDVADELLQRRTNRGVNVVPLTVGQKDLEKHPSPSPPTVRQYL